MTAALRPIPGVDHGRYVPLTEDAQGDLLLAVRAALIWSRLGIDRAAVDRHCAVDVWERPSGDQTVRLVARDFFSDCHLIVELDPETGKPFERSFQ